MMIHWLRKNSAKPDECIEQVFFRAIIIIGLVGCTLVVIFDLLLTKELSYIVPANLVIIQVLLLALFGIKNSHFHSAALCSLVLLDVVVMLRGFVYPEFHHVTCAILITIGFVSALVSKGRLGELIQWGILLSFFAFLFKDYKQVPMIPLVRRALPYMTIYAIITILSGLLRQQYAKHQVRLRDLIAVLNKKNAKIREQHNKLQLSYKELSDLNNNLGLMVTQKTTQIEEKNRQLADIAYENSHSLRAPLARLLGLLHLIKLDPSHKDFYISKLDDQAFEMDRRICMISRSIERNLHL